MVTSITGALSTIASSTAPVAFRQLTVNTQLFGMALGEFLQPALAAVSVTIFRVTDWIHNLDDSTKKSITAGVSWSVGIAATAIALSKLTSIIGIATRSLYGFGLLNPFAALAAGALVLSTRTEQFGQLGAIGERIKDTLMPALEAIGQSALGLAETLAGPLAVAIRAVAITIQTFAGFLESIGSAFGISAEGMGQFVVVAVLMRGALVSLFFQLASTGTAFSIVTSLVNTFTVSLGLSTTAARFFAATLTATGIGAIVVAVTAATSALMSMGGAFGHVSDMVSEASKKIKELEATLEKLTHGGRLSEGDLKKSLTPEEYKRFVDAKTPEGRKTVLEGAKKRVDAEVESGKNPETARRIQAHIEEALSQEIDTTAGTGATSGKRSAGARYRQIRDVALGAGASPEQANEIMELVKKQFPTTLWGGGKLEGKDKVDGPIDPAVIEGIGKLVEDFMGSAAKDAKIIEEAMKNGVGQTKLGMLQSLQQRFPHAFPKEMAAQQIGFGDVRGTYQNLMNNKDPAELRVLEAIRDESIKQREALTRELKELQGKFGG